jgi:hypothetical protein
LLVILRCFQRGRKGDGGGGGREGGERGFLGVGSGFEAFEFGVIDPEEVFAVRANLETCDAVIVAVFHAPCDAIYYRSHGSSPRCVTNIAEIREKSFIASYLIIDEGNPCIVVGLVASYPANNLSINISPISHILPPLKTQNEK